MNDHDECDALVSGQEHHLTTEAEGGAFSQLLFNFTTNHNESQGLTPARLLRLRDALRALETKIGQARVEFESEIASILQGQGGAGDG